MTVLMHGPDSDTIAGAINGTRSGYHRAVSQMIELAAMWLLDLDGLSSGDSDSLWAQLEDKYVDYVTESGQGLKGIFGIDFLDREDFERCFERFIDYRNNMNNSLVAWTDRARRLQVHGRLVAVLAPYRAGGRYLYAARRGAPAPGCAEAELSICASPTRLSGTWRTSKAICRKELSDEQHPD